MYWVPCNTGKLLQHILTHCLMGEVAVICNVYTLTHWGRVTHICVSKLTIIGSDNGLAPVTHICISKLTIIGSDNGLPPDRRQAIIWTNAGLLLIRPLGTNFSEILIQILTFSFKKMHLKVSSPKRRPFCLGLNVFKTICGLVSGVSNAKYYPGLNAKETTWW